MYRSLTFLLLTGFVALLGLVSLGFIDVRIKQEVMKHRWRATVLSVEQEKAQAAKPGSDFKECANGCPVMIVIPGGKFVMGSPENEPNRSSEGPLHEVAIAKPFGVSKFEVTFEEWDACVVSAVCPESQPLGSWRDACYQRELARRQTICRLALAVNWQGVPPSDRG